METTSSMKDANTIFYHIYPLCNTDIDKLHLDCLKTISDYINVIWNSEGFSLIANTHPSPHLYGQLWFDNSMDDEWYTVWILKKISEAHPVAIKVWDDDGDFVLIEAAECLPKWLTPENSKNRLLLYKGDFVMVPQPRSPSEIEIFPQNEVTLHQAINALPHIQSRSGISALINKAVENKCSAFPERNLHKIQCYLPLPLIHAISCRPHLISTIISLYLYSDAREKQQVMKNRQLSWESIHPCNIHLTRCQYAQLYSQRVFTSNAWSHVPVGHVEHDARQLGLKLAVGTELALSIAEGSSISDSEFRKYIKRLNEFGYFENYLEGSQAYNDLLTKAETFYNSSQKQDSGSIWLEKSCQLKKLVSEDFNSEKYITAEVTQSDPDTWMDIIPEDIEKWFLKGRITDKMESDQPENSQVKNDEKTEVKSSSNYVNDINSKLQGFVDNISSFEGAEVPNTDIDLNVDDFMNIIKDFKDQIDGEINKASDSEDTSSLDSEPLGSESEEEMQEYVRELEEQLRGTTLGDTFDKGEDGDVDIDLNLVSNILQSFSADSGLSGPASSVLASLGIHLPRDDKETEGS